MLYLQKMSSMYNEKTMKKIYILFSISILIILGFLSTPDKAQACVNYAFDSGCRGSYYSNKYRNDDIYAFSRRSNYAFRPDYYRYQYDYAFGVNNRHYYPKYAFGSYGY